MKDLIHFLGSMKIAVGLLVLIVVALAGGTILESMRGTDVAARVVYYSMWFRLLLALFAINVICSLIDLWPWGWQRTGFALTHASMLLILAGALVTDQLKIEGRLSLWEGEQSATFQGPGPNGMPRDLVLPFSVKLDSFEIDTYPGTHMPAAFRSRVTVTDPAAGRTFPAVIEMNHELSYAGYKLFQSSYQRTQDRDMTVLSVSKDPGQPIVFTGYALLMLGMFTVLITRILQNRAAGALRSSLLDAKSARRVAALSLAVALSCLFGPAGRVEAAEVPDAASSAALTALPVQHDGRVMPLDTLAREAVLKVTGQREYDGIEPVAMVLGWTFDPDGWAEEPVVYVGKGELAAAAGLSAGVTHSSFHALAGNPRVMGLIGQARRANEQGLPINPLLRSADRLEGRLVFMQQFLQRTIIRPIPDPQQPTAQWSVPEHLDSAADLMTLMARRPAGAAISPALVSREITYNRVQPSRLAWWILGSATLFSILAWSLHRRWLDVAAVAGLLAGFGVMTWGLAARWQIAGRIPASNMYESLLFLGWGVGLFALVAMVVLRSRLVILNATAMSAFTMFLTDKLPLDPFIHPMPPVLSGTPWLAIHVPIIMVSYSVLALGVVVAHMQIGFEIFAPSRRDRVARMSELLYWYAHIGAILLIAGILTGSIWAASSWGRYWGWDPKEVWSLIAFLAYLAILHGRLDRFIGPFGVAALSIVAFWTIIMTYVGVNFVLTAGLHTYGFAGSGVVRWLALIAAIEAIFLTAGLLANRASRRRLSAPRPA